MRRLRPQALQYVVGGLFYDAGLISFAAIMRVLLVLIFMAFGFAQISRDATDKAEAIEAARRVHAILELKSDIDPVSEEGEVPKAPAAGRIEVRDVHFSYPSRREVAVYRDFQLTIEAGQTVALAGPSGCGKSTLVSLLERFYDVDSGCVLLDGVDVRSLRLSWLRSQIGLVSQEPVLFAGTIGWNISLGREGATQEEVEAAAAMANAGFVSDFPDGYETQVGEKGQQLSGGQKQRIAIARAILRDPPILVLDEATSALDASSERVVQAALDSLLRSKQRTTVVIAHRLSTIRDADKIAVVSGGSVVEEGPHDELMTREGGIYRALVDAQQQAPTPTTARRASSLPADATGEQALELDAPTSLSAEPAATLEAVDEAAATTAGKKKEAAAKPPKMPTKWLWGLVAPDRWYFIPGLIGAAITGLAMPAIGYLMSEFLVVFFHPDVDTMRREALKWSIVFVSFGAANSLGAVMRQVAFSTITARMVKRVRCAVFGKVVRQHIGWFDASVEHTAGAIVSQLGTDCFLLQALTGERASLAVSQIIVLVAGLYVSFEASWRLTLVVFVTIPIIVLPVGISVHASHMLVTCLSHAYHMLATCLPHASHTLTASSPHTDYRPR